MPPTLSASVGKKGKNHSADVKTVQSLINGFVSHGWLGSMPPLKVDGDWKPTVPYIESFQKKVVGFNNPDGTISTSGMTWTKLIESPDGQAEAAARFNMVHAAMFNTPRSGLANEVWQAGLASLMEHLDHPKLHKPEIVTFMDFRIAKNEPRLWTVNIREDRLLLKTHVAHGKNSGGSKPHDFGDSNYRTSIGPYITLKMRYTKGLGNVTREEPFADVIGLIKGVNGRAYERGIAFHAASYVEPPTKFGSSNGCFATPISDNRVLIPLIERGSFAFAFYQKT